MNWKITLGCANIFLSGATASLYFGTPMMWGWIVATLGWLCATLEALEHD